MTVNSCNSAILHIRIVELLCPYLVCLGEGAVHTVAHNYNGVVDVSTTAQAYVMY